MKLVVGLGNPGQKFLDTRHNFGWLVLEQLADRLAVEKWRERFDGLLASTGSTRLLKPQTFVNRSGDSVEKCAKFFRLAPERMMIVHDDADLPLGVIKQKFAGTSAGHHGIESIDQAIGAEYWRLRLGIGRAEDNRSMEQFVLEPFTPNEQPLVAQTIDRAVTNLLEWLKNVPPES